MATTADDAIYVYQKLQKKTQTLKDIVRITEDLDEEKGQLHVTFKITKASMPSEHIKDMLKTWEEYLQSVADGRGESGFQVILHQELSDVRGGDAVRKNIPLLSRKKNSVLKCMKAFAEKNKVLYEKAISKIHIHLPRESPFLCERIRKIAKANPGIPLEFIE